MRKVKKTLRRPYTIYNIATEEPVSLITTVPEYIEEMVAEFGPGYDYIEGTYGRQEYTIPADKKPVKRTTPVDPPRPVTNKTKRYRLYPTVQEQLEAIFEGGQAFDDMKQVILTIKQQYPDE